jgi:uncharacterized membrane protein (DUF4010 family)
MHSMLANWDPSALKSIGEALLIGLLVGAQRESTEGKHAGLRDFLLIGLSGGVCGLLGNSWLTAAVLLSIAGLLGLYHFEKRADRTGITTEMAAIATFCLTYLTATPAMPLGAPLAIGSTILVVAFLEFKKRLQHFFLETISDREFNGTLAFLAVILVIYPLLPVGQYGLYGFFSPRQVWFFVILVSSISYAGYFLQKFMGPNRGLAYTSVLGGLASTLATTIEFARRSKREPAEAATLGRAAILANAVQFPRTLFIVYAVNPTVGNICAGPLLAAGGTGALLSWLMFRSKAQGGYEPAPAGNPFRPKPALTFGALFAAIIFLSKAANAELGWQALYATSAVGGIVDPGTVALSAADLLGHAKITSLAAASYIFVALAANIALKAVLGVTLGPRRFAMHLIGGFAVMLAAGGAVWWLMRV